MPNKTIVHKEFEWLEYLEVAERQGPYSNGRGEGTELQWHGSITHKQALHMATFGGYQAVVAEAEKLAARIYHHVLENSLQNSFEMQYQMAGAEVDVGRYLSNEPECMIESTPMKVMKTGRIIRLGVPVCYAYNVSSETVKQRGAAVLACVDVFARAQHPIEIWAGIATTNRFNRGVWLVRVQRADQPLDMGRIMFALAHPAMLRRLGFSVEDAEPQHLHYQLGIGGGYGAPPYALLPEDFAGMGYEQNTIILPDLNYRDRWDEDTAVVWAEDIVNIINTGKVSGLDDT